MYMFFLKKITKSFFLIKINYVDLNYKYCGQFNKKFKTEE